MLPATVLKKASHVVIVPGPGRKPAQLQAHGRDGTWVAGCSLALAGGGDDAGAGRMYHPGLVAHVLGAGDAEMKEGVISSSAGIARPGPEGPWLEPPSSFAHPAQELPSGLPVAWHQDGGAVITIWSGNHDGVEWGKNPKWVSVVFPEEAPPTNAVIATCPSLDLGEGAGVEVGERAIWFGSPGLYIMARRIGDYESSGIPDPKVIAAMAPKGNEIVFERKKLIAAVASVASAIPVPEGSTYGAAVQVRPDGTVFASGPEGDAIVELPRPMDWATLKEPVTFSSNTLKMALGQFTGDIISASMAKKSSVFRDGDSQFVVVAGRM